VLSEDFESGSIPGDWTVIDGTGDGYMWQIYVTSAWGHSSAVPGDSGLYIVGYDDDAAGTNYATEEELILPVFYSGNYNDVSLTYSFGYQNYAGWDTFSVKLRTHDGVSWSAWNYLVLYDYDVGSNAWDILDLTPYLPADSMQVEFNWMDNYGSSNWYVSVDNVTIQGFRPTPNDGGMYSINSPVNDAILGSTVSVNGTVKNYGTNIYSFDATANIYDPLGSLVFTNTQAVSNLPVGDTLNIDFGNISLMTPGEYTIEMFTYAFDDSNTSNDTLMTNIEAIAEGWIPLPDAPAKRLAQATVYDPDDDLFFLIGGDSTGSTVTNTCFEFNPSAEIWTVRAPMPTARDWIEGAYVNGHIHVVAGYDGSGGITTHEVYDISSNVWSTAAAIPHSAGRVAHGLVTWNDSLVYLIGGRDAGSGVSQTTVDFYEPSSDLWTSASPIPIGFDMGGAKIDGNTIYVIGGLEASTSYYYEMVLKGEINPSDPTQITWQWTDSLPYENFNNGLAIKNGKAYMIGGFLGGTASNAVYTYDLITGDWEEIISYPFSIARNHFAERRDGPDSVGVIYCFMGDEGAGWNPTNKCFKYVKTIVEGTDTLYGNVDAFNEPNDEGSIVTARSGPYVYVDTTDVNGDYMIPNIYDGIYDITAARDDYADSVVTGVVITGNTQINFGLYPYAYIYQEDFEADSGDYTATGDWEWGTPTTGPSGAHSGVNLWATVLADDYSISSNSELTTVDIDLTGLTNPMLSFWHWYNTEYSFDGGNVKISVNGGPFAILDSLNPPYDDDAAAGSNAGIPNEPCYSGHNQGYWDKVTRDLSAYEDSTITLKFHFGSDGSIQYPGWYVDDVAVCYVDYSAGIGAGEELPTVYSMVTPGITTSNLFKISYCLPKKSRVSFKVYDCTGREVKHLSLIKEAGWYQASIDMTNRPTGVYFIRMKAGTFKQVRKAIILR
ncbi:immune inhibitor A, partial [candidate division WOR-3 bacterium]|nr:immune inhibitor A [candidate division WOR-3 bacterium]